MNRNALASALGVALLAGCTRAAVQTVMPEPTDWATPVASRTADAAPTPEPSGWSLGGGRIVFEDYNIGAGRHQVWIADAAGVRRLVTSAFDDARPSLSPDGKSVLFFRYGGNPDSAYFVDLDGSNLRPLVCPEQCDPEGDAWSPDGQRLAIDRAFAPLFTNAYGEEEATNVSIWVVGTDGSGLTEVTENPSGSNREDHRPVWSPDGTRLAFVRTDYSKNPQVSAIFTIGVAGSDLFQVTPWKLDANEPDWSPDGTLIAFSSPAASLQPGREQNIFTIHPDGTSLSQLTAHLPASPEGAQGTFDPSWSPDGSRLLFTHIPSFDGLADLYVMDADGGNLHVLARTPDMNESHAVWGVLPAG